MSRQIQIISIPSSAGSTHPGLEQAPAAIRDTGFIDALRNASHTVVECDDHLPVWKWRRDANELITSNVKAAIDYIEHTRSRVAQALKAGYLPLVLGGDCTIEIGVVAASIDAGHRVGLIYCDGHSDLNVPGSVPNGTGEFAESLDWMGVAHMLGVEGAIPELARIGSRHPLLNVADVAVVGFVPEQASDFEKQQIQRLGMRVLNWDMVSRHPEGEMTNLLETWGQEFDHLLVHFDVDVLNFLDTPIADTTASREVGLTLDQAMRVLATLATDSRFSGLTITEINPMQNVKNNASIDALHRFAHKLAQVFN